jgi:hypothetical protein
MNPDIILSAIKKPDKEASDTNWPSSQESKLSALSASDWRKIEQLLTKVIDKSCQSDTQEKQRLKNTVSKLTTNNILLCLENSGLHHAMANEKKKRKRGKPLFKELDAKDDCKAQFFSLTKI